MAPKLDSAIKPPEFADTPVLADTSTIPVEAYKGKQREAAACFQAHSIEMAAEGYLPTWQSWAPGEWAREAYVVAVLLIFLFGVGILFLAYLLIVEPEGVLTVTYERRAATS
jgi:hypothetical protein